MASPVKKQPQPGTPLRALLIVDVRFRRSAPPPLPKVQNDFFEGGPLGVPNASKILPVVNQLRTRSDFFKSAGPSHPQSSHSYFVYTQDWHPMDHVSFAANNKGSKPFTEVTLPEIGVQMMWPRHCLQACTTPLLPPSRALPVLHSTRTSSQNQGRPPQCTHSASSDLVVQKGTNRKYDSYSAFWDNGRKQQTVMELLLRERGVNEVFICGLATDYCVSYTALDAVAAGFRTFLIEDGVRGIDPEGSEAAIKKLIEAGVTVASGDDLVKLGRVMDSVLAQCLKRGSAGIKNLGRMFRIYDDDSSGDLDKREFRKGLRDYGVVLSDEEFDILLKTFDTDNSGTVSFDEFIRLLQPPMSPARLRLIGEAFRKLDKDKSGVITVEDLRGIYNAKKHPKYQAGQWTEDQCIEAFLRTFDTPSSADGKITKQEWTTYYAGVSASIDSDPYFDLMMRNAWGL